MCFLREFPHYSSVTENKKKKKPTNFPNRVRASYTKLIPCTERSEEEKYTKKYSPLKANLVSG